MRDCSLLQRVSNIHRSRALFGLVVTVTWLVARETAAVSARSVYAPCHFTSLFSFFFFLILFFFFSFLSVANGALGDGERGWDGDEGCLQITIPDSRHPVLYNILHNSLQVEFQL